MADEIRKHAVVLEDGRKAEKIVHQETTSSGETKIVTELWAEPQIEKKLTQRVVETKKPIVVTRETETVDETGEVVERKVESIEPQVKMELREHISTNNSVSALSTNECDCYVTQDDMRETFKEGFLAVARALKENKEEEKVSALAYANLGIDEPAPVATSKVSALQINLANKLANDAGGTDVMKLTLWGGLAGALGIFVYVVLIL